MTGNIHCELNTTLSHEVLEVIMQHGSNSRANKKISDLANPL